MGRHLVQVGIVTARKTTSRTTGGKVREGNGKCYEGEEIAADDAVNRQLWRLK
jgi:hypothetical protein